MEQPKKIYPLITYAIILYISLSNLDVVLNVFSKLFSAILPFIIGICIAFVLNLLMNLIEKRLLKKVFLKFKKIQRFKRLISLILTYVLSLAFIVVIVIFIVPQVFDSAKTLLDKSVLYGDKITKLSTSIYTDLGITDSQMNDIFGNMKDILVGLSTFTANTAMKVIDVTLNITSGALNVLIGLIFSIYILASKENLIRIVSRLNKAFNKKPVAEYLSKLTHESGTIFSKFVGGQITEAFILGTLVFIGMLIFKIPYAPLISVMIAITSLIPVVGAFIGTVPSVLIIAMENPTLALAFVVFIIILMQFEGNLIYPRVVGSAIGIGGFWVFLAITIGGGLFGIIGMLLGVPIMAILYGVTRTYVNKKLNKSSKSI